MIQAPDLPGWVALVVALLVLAGAAVTMIGSIGLIRLPSFFERVHAPTLGTSLGMVFIVLASILCFSVLRSRISIHEIVIAVFITVTTPVAFMLLARAALYRDRVREKVDPAKVPEKQASPAAPET